MAKPILPSPSAGDRPTWEFSNIGTIRTCFPEKFGIPRQPGLTAEADGILTLAPPYDQPEMVRELAGFSHIWVLFVFHALADRGFTPTVRPPRLGGNRRIGVLASRSGYRPNPIGMSVVELAAVELPRGRPVLHLRGVDIMDGTPVLDVKPYIPYADCLPQAFPGYTADGPPALLPVELTPQARAVIEAQDHLEPANLERLICQVLAQDPRPAYRRDNDRGRIFGTALAQFNVRWQVVQGRVQVLTVKLRDST